MVAKDSVQREGEIRSRLFHQNLKKQNIAMSVAGVHSQRVRRCAQFAGSAVRGQSVGSAPRAQTAQVAVAHSQKGTDSFFKIKIADINLEKTSSYEHAHTYTYRKKTKKQTQNTC